MYFRKCRLSRVNRPKLQGSISAKNEFCMKVAGWKFQLAIQLEGSRLDVETMSASSRTVMAQGFGTDSRPGFNLASVKLEFNDCLGQVTSG